LLEVRGDDGFGGQEADAPTIQIQNEDTEKNEDAEKREDAEERRIAGAEGTEAVIAQIVQCRLEDIAPDATRQQAREQPIHWTTAS
jgi:hypothetical protein